MAPDISILTTEEGIRATWLQPDPTPTSRHLYDETTLREEMNPEFTTTSTGDVATTRSNSDLAAPL
jgi:hypothetical protein